MNTYRIFWNDYSFEDISGINLIDAMIQSGYDKSDFQSVNHWYLVKKM